MFRPAYDWWPSPAACAHRRHPDIPAVDTGSSVMASRVLEGLIATLAPAAFAADCALDTAAWTGVLTWIYSCRRPTSSRCSWTMVPTCNAEQKMRVQGNLPSRGLPCNAGHAHNRHGSPILAAGAVLPDAGKLTGIPWRQAEAEAEISTGWGCQLPPQWACTRWCRQRCTTAGTPLTHHIANADHAQVLVAVHLQSPRKQPLTPTALRAEGLNPTVS